MNFIALYLVRILQVQIFILRNINIFISIAFLLVSISHATLSGDGALLGFLTSQLFFVSNSQRSTYRLPFMTLFYLSLIFNGLYEKHRLFIYFKKYVHDNCWFYKIDSLLRSYRGHRYFIWLFYWMSIIFASDVCIF